MAIEKNSYRVASKKKLGKEQFTNETSINFEDSLSKLLSLTAEAQVENIEVLDGEASVGGKLLLKALYLNSNNQIMARESLVDFSNKFLAESLKAGQKVDIYATVLEAKADSISDSNMRVVSQLELSAFALEEQSVDVLSSADEEMCCKYTETPVLRLVSDGNENITESLELSIKDHFERLVSVDNKVFVKNYETGTNYISVSGEVVTKALFVTDAETGKLGEATAVNNFKQEIEVSDITPECFLEIDARLKLDGVSNTLTNEEGKVQISSILPINFKYRVYREESVPCVEDMFSVARQTEVVTSSYDSGRFFSPEYFESKIEGSLTLDESKPRIDKILAVSTPFLTPTNSYIKDGEIFLEGIANVYVIYLNDEDGAINSVQMEIPYVISDKTDLTGEPTIVVHQLIEDADVIVKKGRELYFDAKVKALVVFTSNAQNAVITDCKIGEELPPRDCAIEIIFAKAGNSIWEISKKLNVNPQLIMSQNPDVEEVLESDKNLAIYYQLS